jgi:ATP-binding cassette subfamily B protein
VSELVRMTAIYWGVIEWTRSWEHIQGLLRANMLAAQMASGGPEAGQPVGSAGEAVTHFRDDVRDVAMFIDGMIDVSGGVAFTVIAGVLLGATNADAALVLVLPLIAVALVTRTLDSRVKAYRSADREATADVTGLVGDMMAAATTVKVNDASEPLLARLGELSERRRRTATRDRVLDESVMAFSEGTVDIGLGLVLLVAAGGLASGTFDVGDLALFVAYLGWLAFLPRMIGRLMARRKQAGVAFDRMRELVADREAGNTVRPRALPIDRRDRRVRPDAERPARVPLVELTVESLSAHYRHGAGATGGVTDVSFTVRRGDFVVVTGPVGSGKSTLLRALLGLAWNADVSGTVRWNGRPIADRSAFLVPPNAAFLSQVPQLISDSVADNVDEMPDGVATLVGPRGLRLSGGQRQRLATARALVHEPELIVLDDVSSALDVETEVELWDNLAAAGITVIAVSHRNIAFDRASQILRLEHGRLTRRT